MIAARGSSPVKRSGAHARTRRREEQKLVRGTRRRNAGRGEEEVVRAEARRRGGGEEEVVAPAARSAPRFLVILWSPGSWKRSLRASAPPREPLLPLRSRYISGSQAAQGVMWRACRSASGSLCLRNMIAARGSSPGARSGPHAKPRRREEQKLVRAETRRRNGRRGEEEVVRAEARRRGGGEEVIAPAARSAFRLRVAPRLSGSDASASPLLPPRLRVKCLVPSAKRKFGAASEA